MRQFELKSKEEAVEVGSALHGTSQETLAGLGRRDRSPPDVRAGRHAECSPELSAQGARRNPLGCPILFSRNLRKEGG